MRDLIEDPDLLGARLVGVCLEPWVGWGSAVQPGDDDGWETASLDLIVNPGAAADMLASTLPGDNAPVLDLPDIGDGGDAVTHRVADGNTLDLVERAEAAEVVGRELPGLFPGDLELLRPGGEAHRGGAVVDADKHVDVPVYVSGWK